ncbi:hypothetical protein T484DRAFT_1787087 [Baffinella frigidus]|nr:hypothetical protein T484DRAFT_1787087 [Cryptophyta sp. CCMP2293]
MAEAAQPRAARRSVAPDWLAVGSKIHLLYMKKKGKNKGDEVWYNAEVLKHRGGPNHKKGKDPPLEVLVNFDNGLIEEEEWFAEADWPTKLRDREWRRKEKVAELAARAEERKKEKEERKAEKDIKAVEKKKEQKEQKEQEALEEKERTRKKLEEPRESEVKELLALAGADADKLSAEQSGNPGEAAQALLRHPTRKKRKKEGGDDIEGGGDIPAGLEVPGRKRLWKGAKEQLDDPRDAGKQARAL